MQAITLTASAFSLTIATPEGQPIKFSDADDVSENTRRWMSEFKARPLSKPVPLEDVDRKLRTWCACGVYLVQRNFVNLAPFIGGGYGRW